MFVSLPNSYAGALTPYVMIFGAWVFGEVIRFRWGIPRWLSGKESAWQCERCRFHPWMGRIPWRRRQQPAPVFLPGKCHGQRSLAGYSPWGHKDSDTSEGLSTQQMSQKRAFPSGSVVENPPANITKEETEAPSHTLPQGNGRPSGEPGSVRYQPL